MTSFEEVRRTSRNDPCWCGSGKKFKKCHSDRERQNPVGAKRLLRRYFRVFQNGYCLHPKASQHTCSRQIISAHTIRRNGDLAIIAENGHVCGIVNQKSPQYRRNPNTVRRVGIRQASTFRGFCSKHDNHLFSPVEDRPFIATEEQIALLGYRSVCYEVFMKERSIQATQVLRDLDKGRPLSEQKNLQNNLNARNTGFEKALQELTPYKKHYEDVIFSGSFSNIGYCVVSLKEAPEVMCSGITQATHNFLGEKIGEVSQLDTLISGITLSLFATDGGGAAVFTWLADQEECRDVMTTFTSLAKDDQSHAIIRFVFEFFENTYYSPRWWDNLDKEVQRSLIDRHLTGLIDDNGKYHWRSDDCLLDDGIRAVDWEVLSCASSW